VQRDRATLYGAERPRVATACRDRATLRRAEKPRDATWCRGTARRYAVQRDHATSRRAERPRDATVCRGKSCKLKSLCDRDVDRSTTERFGPASGRTLRALPIPPDTRCRRTDSEYAECGHESVAPFFGPPCMFKQFFCYLFAPSDSDEHILQCGCWLVSAVCVYILINTGPIKSLFLTLTQN